MDSRQKKIKILHIASGDLWAGAEVQLYTLSKALADTSDVEISVILLNHGELENKLRDADIALTVLDESTLSDIQILFRLIRHIRTQGPDLIHTHRLKENVIGSLAALLAGRVPSIRDGRQYEDATPFQNGRFCSLEDSFWG